MKSLLVFLMIQFTTTSWSAPAKEKRVQAARSWTEMQNAMEELRKADQIRGWSYIISGSLVTVGGLFAAKNTQDSATKLVYGLTSSAGVAAIGYGIASLSYGNNYNSFYESLKETNLSETQRSSLVANFMENEEERRNRLRRVQMIAHLFAGGLNVYSASVEKDPNAKTFFTVLAGLNLAMSISYSF